MRHVYSIIRYVPNVASGERVNLGLIAGSEDTREWMLLTVDHGSRARARQLGGGEALPGVVSYLERLTADLEHYTDVQAGEQRLLIESPEERTERWLSDLADRQRGVVQFSHPLPVDADSAGAAIDLLWDDLIVEREGRKFPFKKKNTALGAVRQALRAHVDADRVWTSTRLEAEGFSAPVDFAVHDGAVAFLTNCWSFQIPNKERLMDDIQSWAWVVRSLRSKGGSLSGAGFGSAVPEDIGLSIVYVPPATPEDREVFEKARSAFSDPDVKANPVVPFTEASEIVGPVLTALRAASNHAP